VLWWASNRGWNFDGHLASILFSHKKCFAGSSLKFLNSFHVWELPTNRLGYSAKLLDIESNISAIASVGELNRKRPFVYANSSSRLIALPRHVIERLQEEQADANCSLPLQTFLPAVLNICISSRPPYLCSLLLNVSLLDVGSTVTMSRQGLVMLTRC
jgi:hypothetical protein